MSLWFSLSLRQNIIVLDWYSNSEFAEFLLKELYDFKACQNNQDLSSDKIDQTFIHQLNETIKDEQTIFYILMNKNVKLSEEFENYFNEWLDLKTFKIVHDPRMLWFTLSKDIYQNSKALIFSNDQNFIWEEIKNCLQLKESEIPWIKQYSCDSFKDLHFSHLFSMLKTLDFIDTHLFEKLIKNKKEEWKFTKESLDKLSGDKKETEHNFDIDNYKDLIENVLTKITNEYKKQSESVEFTGFFNTIFNLTGQEMDKDTLK